MYIQGHYKTEWQKKCWIKKKSIGQQFPISASYLVSDQFSKHIANTDMLFAPKELIEPVTSYAKSPVIATFLLFSWGR